MKEERIKKIGEDMREKSGIDMPEMIGEDPRGKNETDMETLIKVKENLQAGKSETAEQREGRVTANA